MRSAKCEVRSVKGKAWRLYCRKHSSFEIRHSKLSRAFTLIEVMIASGILFACLFAVLALLSNCLQSARLLRQSNVDIGMLAAELSLTNRLMEGPINGDFSDQYPDYFWDGEITEVSTNGLFQVEFNIHRRGSNRASDGNLSILLFRPESQRGRFPPRRF